MSCLSRSTTSSIAAPRCARRRPTASSNALAARCWRNVAITLRERFYEALEPLQDALDAWLIHYNCERPHRGYRNLGRRPLDRVTQYISTVRQEA